MVMGRVLGDPDGALDARSDDAESRCATTARSALRSDGNASAGARPARW
jgi:hypothetical protein